MIQAMPVGGIKSTVHVSPSRGCEHLKQRTIGGHARAHRRFIVFVCEGFEYPRMFPAREGGRAHSRRRRIPRPRARMSSMSALATATAARPELGTRN